MFDFICEGLSRSRDGRWELRAKERLAGVVVPGSAWELYRLQTDGTWKLVVEAATHRELRDAVVTETASVAA